MRNVCILLMLTVICGTTVLTVFGQQPTASQPLKYDDIPLNIEAPVQPIPVKGVDGKWYLVYRLFLTNIAFSDLTLKSVEVSDATRKNVLTRYTDKELADIDRYILLTSVPLSEMPNKQYPRQISGGRTGALFFWLTVDSPAAIPTVLKHRFVFEPNPRIKVLRGFESDKEGGEMVLDGYNVSVSSEKPVVIGAPLAGNGDWVCNGGPAYNSYHQVFSTRAGRMRMSQLFACDFQKIDKGFHILPNPFPDEITNKMFYGYGAEVLAVGDGKVVFVKDGIPENVPQASGVIKPAVPLTRETGAGNWIAIDLGNNRYALYAHLQPGSIRVKVGDKVHKGQTIALVGNSGNAVGPHLHFQIGNEYRLNGGDFNGNEGLPFVFDSFTVGGQKHRMEMPINKTVMQFQ